MHRDLDPALPVDPGTNVSASNCSRLREHCLQRLVVPLRHIDIGDR
jgi:hypothetical protein